MRVGDHTGVDISRGAGRTARILVVDNHRRWDGPCCSDCSRPFVTIQMAARGCPDCGCRRYERGRQ